MSKIKISSCFFLRKIEKCTEHTIGYLFSAKLFYLFIYGQATNIIRALHLSPISIGNKLLKYLVGAGIIVIDKKVADKGLSDY